MNKKYLPRHLQDAVRRIDSCIKTAPGKVEAVLSAYPLLDQVEVLAYYRSNSIYGIFGYQGGKAV